MKHPVFVYLRVKINKKNVNGTKKNICIFLIRCQKLLPPPPPLPPSNHLPPPPLIPPTPFPPRLQLLLCNSIFIKIKECFYDLKENRNPTKY